MKIHRQGLEVFTVQFGSHMQWAIGRSMKKSTKTCNNSRLYGFFEPCFRKSDMCSCDVLHAYVISLALFTASGLQLTAIFLFLASNNLTFCILVHLHLLFTKGVWTGIGCKRRLLSPAPTFLAPALYNAAAVLLLQRNTVWQAREIQLGRTGKYMQTRCHRAQYNNIHCNKSTECRFAAGSAAWHS